MNVVVVEGTVVALIGQAGMGKVNVLVIAGIAGEQCGWETESD
jgi:hypothetical protein